MRLFIGISPTEEIRKGLVEAQESLQHHGVTGTYLSPENLHMTLAFIGEYSNPEHVLEVMKGVSFSPFTITLDGFGSFGDLWWAGLAKSDDLSSFVKRLRHALSDAEIPFDKKKFSPHITLVRKSVCRKGLPKVNVPHKSMTVKKISLYRSDRGKNGMIYTELGALTD